MHSNVYGCLSVNTSLCSIYCTGRAACVYSLLNQTSNKKTVKHIIIRHNSSSAQASDFSQKGLVPVQSFILSAKPMLTLTHIIKPGDQFRA